MVPTLLLFFLSPPKNLLIWSIRPGFFFFLPSPKPLCPEVLAVAMAAADVDLSLLSPKPTVPTPSCVLLLHQSVWRSGGSCLWRCHHLGPPRGTVGHWESGRREGRVREVHGSGSAPGIHLGFRGCVSHRRGHCSASPRPRGQQGWSLSVNSHPDARQRRALWAHCWPASVKVDVLRSNWTYSRPDERLLCKRRHASAATRSCDFAHLDFQSSIIHQMTDAALLRL